MTYQKHLLYAWGGTMANGAEIWSNSLRFKGTDLDFPYTEGGLYDILDSFIADTKLIVTDAAAGMNNTVRLTWAKLNPINEFGKYASPSRTIGRVLETADQVTGAVGTYLPTFVTCAVSLKTPVQRGPASAGRFFIPGCSFGVGPTGEYNPATMQAAAEAYAQYLSNLANFPGPDFNSLYPHVVSDRGQPGPAEPVEFVQIGSVPDVMRSRKNALIEDRVTVAVP